MKGAIAPPDPFVLNGGHAGVNVSKNGLSVRSFVIDPTKRTLVLFTAGQSQLGNVMPSAYVPTNSLVIDNLNITDGALYNVMGRLLGCTNSAPPVGTGNIAARIADTLVTNNKFHRVILVPLAIGGSRAAQWATGGVYSDRMTVALRRLSARGVTAATTGVTMACLMGVGETDGLGGTTSVSFTASVNSFISNANAAGFVGRYFLTRETWISGNSNSTVQNAQAAMVNNMTIWSGGDWDSLNASNRQADNTHFNDTGGLAAAALTVAAMANSGAPF